MTFRAHGEKRDKGVGRRPLRLQREKRCFFSEIQSVEKCGTAEYHMGRRSCSGKHCKLLGRIVRVFQKEKEHDRGVPRWKHKLRGNPLIHGAMATWGKKSKVKTEIS